MPNQRLAAVVARFAQATHHLSEPMLNSETWAWEAYVGVRYAFLQTYLELRDLAARLLAERTASAQPPTEAQRALAQHHAAFRDFQSLLIGIDDAFVTTPPAVAEWPVNVILTHVHEVEGYFFATILNALRNPEPKRVNAEQRAVLLGADFVLNDQASLAVMWQNYEQFHERLLAELASLSPDQLAIIAPMWEPGPVSVRFRLHRFEAHLREHTNQLEKTIRALGQAPNEAKMLLRQVYAALAEVEGALIGANDLGQAECAALAQTIEERLGSLLNAVEQTLAIIDAVKKNDLARAQALLAVDSRLGAARDDNDLPLILTAAYQGQPAIAAALATAKGELDIFEGVVTGNLEEVKLNVEYNPASLNDFARDGFTALQLAAFFGQEEIVHYLLQAGADVHAVAQNKMQIQPLHAALANNNFNITQAILEHGADANAQQQDGFTPLMAAVQHKNEALVELLRAFGAVG